MTVESLPPAALREAVATLWAVPPPGPENICYAPEFVRVREVSKTLYPEEAALDPACPGCHEDYL